MSFNSFVAKRNAFVAKRSAGASDDSGLAAVELVFSLLMLFALVALCAPLGTLLLTQTRLERAAGQAARFATQVPDRGRPGSTGIKPTIAEIQAVATSSASAAGINVSTDFATPVVTQSNGTAPASLVTVKLTKTVQITGFAGILAFVGLAPNAVTVNATATGRQE